MDSLNNNNNNNHTSDHETSPMKSIQNLSTTAIHPLQDVPLTTATHESMPEMQQQQHQQFPSKKNWVKFDDDVNEISSSSGGDGGVGDRANNFTENNFNNNKPSYDQIDSTALPATNKLSTSPTTTTRKALLPPPLPPPQAVARPRSPHGREKLQNQLQRESVAISPLNTSPTPAQRSMVSSTSVTPTTTNATANEAPAVLTTESTHVNLNASGKAQQQQQHHNHLQQHSTLPQQQQLQQQQQQQLKSKTGGSQLQQQQHQQPLQAHHHIPATTKAKEIQHHNINGGSSSNNNGTTASTAPPTTTNNANAMHHKSHHQQAEIHAQTHPHATDSSTALTIEEATSSSAAAAAAATTGPPAMRTIELSTGRIREGFANGDVIVTLLPANTKWPWITPAIFRPELVPEELMAQGLTLTVEEYVQAMETLVNDYRFTLYNICYKRILVCWIVLAFVVLLTLLFSGLQGVALFSLGVGWLFLNAASIFLCMWVKLRLARGLEKCLARVNRQLMKHKILLILDDRGHISCHKVNLCFLYFDSTQCINFLNEFLETTEQNGGEEIKAGWESKLDIDLSDIVIQGSNPVRLSRKQEWGIQMFLRYSSRWGMEALRGLVDITPMEPGRHCGQFQCPCQYIKQHLEYKPRVSLNSIGQVVWTRYPTSLK